ncbi:MAG TPA: hypothetical protein VJ998_10005, partial [Pseudomonadales bacterium]|nr:hypothetical protein [Pseudomonadales bacterium]
MPLVSIVLGAALMLPGQYLLGLASAALIDRCTGERTLLDGPTALTTGICIHLGASYALLCLGIAWWAGILLPLLPGLVLVRSAWRNFRRPGLPGINGLLWTMVTAAIGLSMLVYTHGYKTYWEPAAGDYAFHLSIIHSFVFGGNFPAEYPIFYGVSLSYPFLADLWSAMLWSPSLTPTGLAVVFAVQWLVLWQIILHRFSGADRAIFPWLLLFGGGSYAMLAHFHEYSWRLLRSVPNMPWSTFLASIWIPQRSALLGATICLAAISLASRRRESFSGMILAGILLGIAPLAQTDFALVTALFCGLTALFDCVAARMQSHNRSMTLTRPEMGLVLLTATTLVVALPSLLLFSAKTGLITFIQGWNVPKLQGASAIGSVSNSLVMWCVNTWQWWLAIAVVGLRYRRRRGVAVIGILFALANTVQFAVWEWDQIKLFVALYIVFIALWASTPRRDIRIDILLAVLLCAPALIEYTKFATRKPVRYFIFSENKVDLAARLREVLPQGAKVTGAPVYDNPILLSGRPVFTSFIGWLYTHHLDYWYRRQINRNLEAILQCGSGTLPIPATQCPDYLLWDKAARQYWHRAAPPNGFSTVAGFGDATLYAVGAASGARASPPPP